MKTVEEEMAMLREKHGEKLDPKIIVEFAKDPSTALHSQFEWDDIKAGYEYRLEQARRLIRVVVTYNEQVKENVRVYVSLPSDRRQGGGYRLLADVLSDEERREELMKQALSELIAVKRRYAILTALSPVFKAIEKAQRKFQFEHPAQVPAKQPAYAVA